MPLTVSNRQASPVGLLGVPTAYKIAPQPQTYDFRIAPASP